MVYLPADEYIVGKHAPLKSLKSFDILALYKLLYYCLLQYSRHWRFSGVKNKSYRQSWGGYWSGKSLWSLLLLMNVLGVSAGKVRRGAKGLLENDGPAIVRSSQTEGKEVEVIASSLAAAASSSRCPGLFDACS